MRTTYWLFLGIVLILNLSCGNSEQISEETATAVIATIDGENITYDELIANFNRNRVAAENDSSAIHEFFTPYVHYRLKLHEGIQKGYDKDSTILSEFNEYASEIAYKYWIENQIKNERIETFNERFEHELKAFHILRELSENASSETELEVRNELMAVRDSLLNGASPEIMNERYSSKRDGNSMGGQLSWVTAGTTIKPFEDAVYNLDIGEISEPVRTQFGYHLIILQDIRRRTPQRLVKHIFIPRQEGESGIEKINRAFTALESDTSWSEVVSKYSEDPSTINRDGLLGWIGYGSRYPTELIDSAMSTSPDSAYSEPIEASYGYHIMKIDSVRTFSTEEQKEEFIVERLQQLGRLNPDHDDVISRIASEGDLNVYRENFDELLNLPADSQNTMSDLELIRFMDLSYDASHFQDWLRNRASVDDVMQSGDIVASYRDAVIRDHIVDFTRRKFPEFAKETDHFLHGLIVFKVNEENLWNPKALNQDDLKNYYESNKNQYKKGKTFLYTEIIASSDSLMAEIQYQLSNGLADPETIEEQFEKVRMRTDSTSNPQTTEYKTVQALNPGEFSEIISVEDRVSMYILNDIQEERNLGFEEAYGQVFSDYQPIWEEEFLNKLKEQYDLQLYPENLH